MWLPRDIVEQADWYAAQWEEALAKGWEKAVTAAMLRVVSRPAVVALCKFRSPELRGVRRITISGFPKHLLFYIVAHGEILVLRVVHGARDLERLLSTMAEDQLPMREYTPRLDREMLAEVTEADQQVQSGHYIRHADIKAWLLSWGTEGELAPPKCICGDTRDAHRSNAEC